MIRGLAACLITAAIFLVHPSTSAAQSARVVEAASGSPIPGAEVVWATEGDRGARIVVDADGRFEVPAAWLDGTLEVSALGYRTASYSVAEAIRIEWRLALVSDPLELDAVVVTASGRSLRRSEVAVPIEQITRAEIEVSGASSVESALTEVPGLQASPGVPVGSTIRIRGIGDSRVLVLIDGQPATGALLEDRDLTRISIAGTERIEVVKGPMSSLYGSDALGGVINVITRPPKPGLALNGRLLSGGAGRMEGDVTVSGGGALRTRVTGSWRQEDRVPGLDRDIDTFARVWDLRSTTRYTGWDRVSLRADGWFVRERQRWPVGGGFNGFNDNHGLTGWTEAVIEAGPGAWTARLFGQSYEHEFRSARGNSPIAGSGEGAQTEGLWEATVAYGASVGAHRFDLGVEGATRSIESPNKILQDRAADDQLALYGQDAIRWGRSTWTTGVRATFNDRWGSTVAPSFGVAVVPTDRISAKANVGRGFRAPSFKELAWDFANLGAGYSIQGHPDLMPEHSWSVTAGVDYVAASGVVLGAEVYRNRIRDLIETTFVNFLPSGLQVFSPRNLGQARTQGFELRASVERRTWEVDAEYAFLDARSLDLDLALDRRARHSGRLRATRAISLLDGGSFSTTVRWLGAAPLIGLNAGGQPAEIGRQDAFLSIDGHATLAIRTGARVVLGVSNLLDAQPAGWQAVVQRRVRFGLEVGGPL